MSDKEKAPELIMLYEFTGTRIAEFKSQQWAITNYGALIYAAIVSSKALFKDISNWEITLLNIAAFLVCGVGIWLIRTFAESIAERQKCLSSIRAEFGEDFQRVWCGGSNLQGNSIRPKTILKKFHQMILISGFIITTAMIWRI